MKKTHNDSLTPKKQQQVELADIFRLYADDYRRSHPVSYQQSKVLHHIEICRTAELGGHVEQCDQCAFEKNAYNSCRDRHCPKCQTLTKEQWLMQSALLQVPSRYLSILAATLTGWPYLTIGSSPLITAASLLPTAIGEKTIKSKK